MIEFLRLHTTAGPSYVEYYTLLDTLCWIRSDVETKTRLKEFQDDFSA